MQWEDITICNMYDSSWFVNIFQPKTTRNILVLNSVCDQAISFKSQVCSAPREWAPRVQWAQSGPEELNTLSVKSISRPLFCLEGPSLLFLWMANALCKLWPLIDSFRGSACGEVWLDLMALLLVPGLLPSVSPMGDQSWIHWGRCLFPCRLTFSLWLVIV